MTVILLPPKPALKTDSPTMLDWGGQLTPPNGGPVQTLQRLGTRHALEFTIPIMPTEPLGRIWAATLRMAKLYGCLLPFGQDGLVVGPCGSPKVAGANQAGSSITMSGFTKRYEVRFGQAFSIFRNGRRYLHFAAEAKQADGQGNMTLGIFPMLRIVPNDGDLCEFARPMIQGSLAGNTVKWSRLSAPWSDFGTITVTEDE